MANVVNKAFRYGTPADSIGNPEDEPADDVNDPQTVISLLKKLILVGSLEAAAALGHRVALLEQQMEALTERVDILEQEAASDDTWQTGVDQTLGSLDTRLDNIEAKAGSNVTLRFEYTFDSGIIAPPSATQFRMNSVNQQVATLFWFHNSDADSIAQQNFLKLITAGTTLFIQQKSDATKWQRYKVTQPAVDKTGYFEVTATWQEQGGVIPTGQRVVALIYRA